MRALLLCTFCFLPWRLPASAQTTLLTRVEMTDGGLPKDYLAIIAKSGFEVWATGVNTRAPQWEAGYVTKVGPGLKIGNYVSYWQANRQVSHLGWIFWTGSALGGRFRIDLAHYTPIGHGHNPSVLFSQESSLSWKLGNQATFGLAGTFYQPEGSPFRLRYGPILTVKLDKDTSLKVVDFALSTNNLPARLRVQVTRSF